MSTPTTSTSAAGVAARNRERIERVRQHLARIAAALVNDFLERPFSFDAFREWLAPKSGG